MFCILQIKLVAIPTWPGHSRGFCTPWYSALQRRQIHMTRALSKTLRRKAASHKKVILPHILTPDRIVFKSRVCVLCPSNPCLSGWLHRRSRKWHWVGCYLGLISLWNGSIFTPTSQAEVCYPSPLPKLSKKTQPVWDRGGIKIQSLTLPRSFNSSLQRSII